MNAARATRAEREFLDSLSQIAAAPIDEARAVQQRIDAARPFRLPVPDVIEIPLEDLTRRERDSFFGAFDDTQPGELA